MVKSSTLSSVVFSWSPPQEPNGIIIAYEVTFRINSSDPIMQNSTSTPFTLNLARNTRVSDISVHAYTSIGPGDVVTTNDVLTPLVPTPRKPLATFDCQ